ncbi:RND family efflux transporter, MFP subunit [Colwellia chukchiensis]|uniref:RND family efflux transporter, MFP subunit n=1 Tax=Colwellia chukchiensis TaxID=641665 RepID=A0A1H7SBV4_9GAMM|nr:efflux RND transporter periplasmic adaptor subunit [Colwellia chukchiensis]SEL70122.1 RND family efflux transporter, MFP subunit [Colwellia chukchiensis]
MKFFSLVIILLSQLAIFVVSAQQYHTEVIRAELYSGKIERTGKLDYKRRLNLSFKTRGYLTLLTIDEGEQFAKGQLLASLDITELKQEKNSHYAQLMQAKREVTRISQLLANNLASERDLDQAKTQVETIRAAYQVAYYNLEKAQLYAPFSGVVLARHTELGELQAPGQIALTVAKQEWIIKVALTGQEVSQVQLNQVVEVTLHRIGKVTGYISKIPAIATNNNLFTIEVSLPKLQASNGIIAGQLAAVSIPFDSNSFVYRLPIAALVAIDDVGKAIVVAQAEQDAKLSKLSFDISQLSNDYVYLKASQQDKPIKIITQGWQQFPVAEQ